MYFPISVPGHVHVQEGQQWHREVHSLPCQRRLNNYSLLHLPPGSVLPAQPSHAGHHPQPLEYGVCVLSTILLQLSEEQRRKGKRWRKLSTKQDPFPPEEILLTTQHCSTERCQEEQLSRTQKYLSDKLRAVCLGRLCLLAALQKPRSHRQYNAKQVWS